MGFVECGTKPYERKCDRGGFLNEMRPNQWGNPRTSDFMEMLPTLTDANKLSKWLM